MHRKQWFELGKIFILFVLNYCFALVYKNQKMNYKNTQINFSAPIKNFTQKENYRLSENSLKDNILTCRQTGSIFLYRNTFIFKEINSQTRQKSSQRIHGKMGTKRMGGKVVLIKQKDKVERNDSNASKIENNQKSNIEYENKKTTDQQFKATDRLSIKSYKFENNLQPANEDQSFLSSKQKQKISSKANLPLNQKQYQEQELFKEVKRKMMAQSQFFKYKKKQQNCFYSNLKSKLKTQMMKIEEKQDTQMMKIEEKQDYDRIHFTIQGCNANIHFKTNSRMLRENKRHRLQTALNSFYLDTYSLNKMIPLSQRAKSYQSLQKNINFYHLKNKTEEILHNTKRIELHTERPKHNRILSQNKMIQTTQYTFSKKDRHVRNHSEDNFKMNRILGDCDHQTERNQILKNNFQIFQFYCKKVDSRFQRVSHQLDIVQNFQIQ